jgi:hypothetical protein
MSLRTLRRWFCLGQSREKEAINKKQEENEERQKRIDKLNKLETYLLKSSSRNVDLEFLESYGITCEELAFNDGSYSRPLQPCFFQPWPQNCLLKHPINMDSPETKEDVHINRKGVLSGFEPVIKLHYEDHARSLCSFINHEFAAFPRKGTKSNALSIWALTKWIPW